MELPDTLQNIIADPVDGIMQIFWRRSRNSQKHYVRNTQLTT